MDIVYTKAIDNIIPKPEVVTPRYSLINTRSLINTVESMGYPLAQVSVRSTRDKDMSQYAKHLLRFRMPNLINQEDAPEIIIINSHDGTGALRIKLGWFRFACANGLIAGESLASLSLRHRNITTEAIQDLLTDYVRERVPMLLETRDNMKAAHVTEEDKSILCEVLNSHVYPEGTYPAYSNELLHTRRHEDQESTLWNVYNRLQENVIQGGQLYMKRTVDPRGYPVISRNTRRKVKGLNRVESLNGLVFDTCNQMLHNAL